MKIFEEKNLEIGEGHEAGLLVLTGRPVNRPAGRPAKTIVLAGQKRPKLNISRNLHDFA